jgi:hypothetical protein
MFIGFKKDHIPRGPLKTTLVPSGSAAVELLSPPIVALLELAPPGTDDDDDAAADELDSLPLEDPPPLICCVLLITPRMWFSILSLFTVKDHTDFSFLIFLHAGFTLCGAK